MNAAMHGCLVRELYIKGEEITAHQELPYGEQEALLMIQLTNEVEADIRNGLTIYDAISKAIKAGYLGKFLQLESKEN